jgi:flavin reductase (DIM6/NTAB) family NADH-FMN oxidoreductase RutF
MIPFLPGSLDVREPQNPPLSEKEFRAVMGSIASTVSIVTATHEGEVLGRTVTSLFSLSLSPPTLLVSINMMSRLADLIAQSGRFSVSVLARDQQVIADAFAGRFGEMDRFAFGVWGQWPSGNPQLYGAATNIDCELVGSIEASGHMLFAGSLIEAETTAKDPLIWHKRQYKGLEG